MKKEAKTDNNTPQNDASSKIEVIKNLIFGENIEAYNSEFDNLKNDILKKKKELESLVEEVKSDLNQTLDNLSTDINIRITELENSLEEKADNLDAAKVDKETLGKLLVDLGEKIRNK
ncbi:fructose 1,6-bisphosphatase [Leptobacterium flavescens]|uniref:Fructose 1,6-bisphosphatase n=1 Tax=Leptobacterium flavescens TaxID=472055 RepID=A0A6P0UK53_9FLAO|nr:fructose 1,6-bisphosphatase [Leptobacterium flavescens]NER12932.1 fructose 1,6-bisphosphatase [Leptobacterium flavescens]